MLSQAERRFLESRRVAYLATADARGAPHVVPVCFAVAESGIYITIDEKPKRVAARALKRLRNIAENPQVALVADRYDDRDWSRLGWVMVRGRAEVLEAGPEHDAAQLGLRARSYDRGRYAPQVEMGELQFHRLLAESYRRSLEGQ